MAGPDNISLSNEDLLRLHVLMTREVQAIRIEAASMAVHALTPEGEVRITLNPSGSSEIYLRRVREFLAGQALGSPGGYPVHLQRWTRMGQAREQGLDKLLLLGEPEAVVSVAYSAALTDELARRAWWAMPVADNARRMLECPEVAQGRMGPLLAEHLVEHLPFETDPHTIIDTLRHVLQPGLLADAPRLRLWNKAHSNPLYYIGFLERTPDDLPGADQPHPSHALLDAAPDSDLALQMRRALSPSGQVFLHTFGETLRTASNQDVVAALFRTLAHWLNTLHPQGEPLASLDAVTQRASDMALTRPLPGLEAEAQALLFLSGLHESLLTPIFRRSSAAGSLMRKKISPVTDPLLQAIERLCHPRVSGTAR